MKICVFGSSSNKTPQKYLDVAYELGQAIGEAGHHAVTGGGSFGCMRQSQDGCIDAGGKVTFVVHQSFVDGGSSPALDEKTEGLEEVVCCKGDDLTERKRLLMDKSDALIVCPGGVGTFDEVWDAVSHKSLSMKGLNHKAIVLLNTDGFYDGFVTQLHRAAKEGLLYLPPEKFFFVTPNPKEAVQLVQDYYQNAMQNGEEDLGKGRRKQDITDDKLPAFWTSVSGNSAFDRVTFVTGAVVGALLAIAAVHVRKGLTSR
jgi:uncharacterized protein (TIGR00730 family)